MAWTKGFNFRLTSTYVTDGTDETYVIGDVYPTTRNGVTFGWEGGGSLQMRNRSTSNDRRLAGISWNDTTAVDFRVDLPNPGNFELRLAHGDVIYDTASLDLNIKDTNTVVANLVDANGTGAANSFIDANVNEFTAANWPANNTARTLAFSTTIFRARIRSGFTDLIAHISLNEVAAAGGVPKHFMHYQRQRTA